MKQAGTSQNQSAIRIALILVPALIVASLLWHTFSGGSGSHRKIASLRQKWEFTATGAITASLALGSDGTLYAAGEDGLLYALDPAGNLKWKFGIFSSFGSFSFISTQCFLIFFNNRIPVTHNQKSKHGVGSEAI